jgi:hypothetical protein
MGGLSLGGGGSGEGAQRRSAVAAAAARGTVRRALGWAMRDPGRCKGSLEGAHAVERRCGREEKGGHLK